MGTDATLVYFSHPSFAVREILPLHWVRGGSLVDFYGSNHSDVSARCVTDTGESDCQAAHVQSILGYIHDRLKDQSGSGDSEKHELLHTPGLHKTPLSGVRYLLAILLTEMFLYTLDDHFDIPRVLTARGGPESCVSDAFARTNHLRDGIICGTHAQGTTKLTLPWAQFICNIDHLIQLMANAPNLDVLEISIEWHYPWCAGSLLRSLRLWDPTLLDYLILPALECLDLDLDNGDLYASALEGFTQRPGGLHNRGWLAGIPKNSSKLPYPRILSRILLRRNCSMDESILFKLFRIITCIAKDNALLPRWERSLGSPIFHRSSFLFDGRCLVEMIESQRVTGGVGS
ncbi:hypothetical protein EDD85DRAFT_995607 [Armillaria nabsnona]|nr:hypothetical protein EDD85DRAFT_995607 [Armillaria nabsnona]